MGSILIECYCGFHSLNIVWVIVHYNWYQSQLSQVTCSWVKNLGLIEGRRVKHRESETRVKHSEN